MALSGSTDFLIDGDTLISQALRVVGQLRQNQTASTDQLTDGRTAINLILKGWVADGLNLNTIKNVSKTLVADQQSYTVGTGLNISIPKPQRIVYAYYTNSNSYDREIYAISRQEYFNLSNKASQGDPTQYYYDPLYANGVLYIWPVPNSVTTEAITLFYQKPYDDIDGATDDFELPTFYFNALKYELALQLALEYPVEAQKFYQIRDIRNTEKRRAMEYDREDTSLFLKPTLCKR